MSDLEIQWDRILKVKTSGRDDTGSDQFRYPYEPTPYTILERVARSGYLGKTNRVIDYGTGKGRVCFFLSYQSRCKSIGVEYNDRIFESALKNKESAVSGRLVEIVEAAAEEYEVPEDVDVCYFFNPFSIEIFKKVIARITESCDRKPRRIILMFYFIQDEYLTYLMSNDRVTFLDEIDCSDLYNRDKERERIVIFEMY